MKDITTKPKWNWIYLIPILTGIWCYTDQNWLGLGLQVFVLVLLVWMDIWHAKQLAVFEEHHQELQNLFENIQSPLPPREPQFENELERVKHKLRTGWALEPEERALMDQHGIKLKKEEDE